MTGQLSPHPSVSQDPLLGLGSHHLLAQTQVLAIVMTSPTPGTELLASRPAVLPAPPQVGPCMRSLSGGQEEVLLKGAQLPGSGWGNCDKENGGPS